MINELTERKRRILTTMILFDNHEDNVQSTFFYLFITRTAIHFHNLCF